MLSQSPFQAYHISIFLLPVHSKIPAWDLISYNLKLGCFDQLIWAVSETAEGYTKGSLGSGQALLLDLGAGSMNAISLYKFNELYTYNMYILYTCVYNLYSCTNKSLPRNAVREKHTGAEIMTEKHLGASLGNLFWKSQGSVLIGWPEEEPLTVKAINSSCIFTSALSKAASKFKICVTEFWSPSQILSMRAF